MELIKTRSPGTSDLEETSIDFPNLSTLTDVSNNIICRILKRFALSSFNETIISIIVKVPSMSAYIRY